MDSNLNELLFKSFGPIESHSAIKFTSTFHFHIFGLYFQKV